jgi:hypothetical protein
MLEALIYKMILSSDYLNVTSISGHTTFIVHISTLSNSVVHVTTQSIELQIE